MAFTAPELQQIAAGDPGGAGGQTAGSVLLAAGAGEGGGAWRRVQRRAHRIDAAHLRLPRVLCARAVGAVIPWARSSPLSMAPLGAPISHPRSIVG